MVAQPRREVIALTPDEQMEFWTALNQTSQVTDAQRDQCNTHEALY